jgi:SET domain-containing protein
VLLVKSRLAPSPIHGIGVFAGEPIRAGTEVWRFTPGFDQRFALETFAAFPPSLQDFLAAYGWRSRKSGLLCYAADNARHFNHSDEPSCRSEYRDGEDEVVTVALRDIGMGEELTDDYRAFDAEAFAGRFPSGDA